MSSHCRMGPASAIFLCVLVRGMDGVPPKPSSDFDKKDRLLPPRSPKVILPSFFSGLQNHQVNKLLQEKHSNQHVKIYRNILKKHILGRSDVNKKSADSLEGRSDPSSLGSNITDILHLEAQSSSAKQSNVIQCVICATAQRLYLLTPSTPIILLSHDRRACDQWCKHLRVS